MKKNYKIIIIFLIGFLSITYFSVNYLIGKNKGPKLNDIKQLFNQNQKEFIKKYFFPYKTISQQRKIISGQKENISNLKKNIYSQELIMFDREATISVLQKYAPSIEDELKFKNELKDITVFKKERFKLSNDLIITKYLFLKGFYFGMDSRFPGSGYIDFHFNNLIVLSARGILGYSSDLEEKLAFKQIKNNIDDFFDLEQIKKDGGFSVRDLAIHENKIYISYNEQIRKDCWNTGIIYSEINYDYIEFRKLFSSKECVHSKNNLDSQFKSSQGGGRIVVLDNENILLSVGEYRSRFLAQELDSINGKIIKININNSNYEIVSMGHRNPQGLYYNKKYNFILETEHGPQGGDEINLIKLDHLNKNKIPNYGWPIASEGEHYGGGDEYLNAKYPIPESHKKHGFIEPLKSFTPSIGISEITKINNNYYVASSLKSKSLYFFELNNENKIINQSTIQVFERVRDIIFKGKKLYLFLEDTASIGIIELN